MCMHVVILSIKAKGLLQVLEKKILKKKRGGGGGGIIYWACGHIDHVTRTI